MYTLYCGDALEILSALPAHSAHCCVTSPPYWGQRDYEIPGQLGMEPTPALYAGALVKVFRELYRVLHPRGTLWLVLGDTYVPSHADHRTNPGKNYGHQAVVKGSRARDKLKPSPGYKAKDLAGIPWLVAAALRTDGWYLRQDIIWAKTAHLPENVHDRFVRSHEHIFLLAKRLDYFFSPLALKEPSVQDPTKTRNRRDVWRVATAHGYGGHRAAFPPKLITPCVLAGTPPRGTVIDPFCGSSTTGVVTLQHGFNYIGIDLDEHNMALSEQRLSSL